MAGMWGNGSCSTASPEFLVKSLLHFSCCPHLGQMLPCSWLAKWKETEDTRGREMSLCSFIWHRSATFLLHHGYAQGRWELGLFLTLSQALGTHFLGAWKLMGSPFSRGGSKGAIYCMLYVSNILTQWRHPDPLSGTMCYQREACRLHCCAHSLPHRAASKSSCILSWREPWLSPKTTDRASTKAYSLKICATTSGKLWGRRKHLVRLIWWLAAFTTGNRNGVNVPSILFLLYLFLPKAFSPSALSTHCYIQCCSLGTKQSVRISPAWQCFCITLSLLLCLLADTSACEQESRSPVC